MTEPGINIEDVDFEQLYQGKSPLGPRMPWDIGAAQPAIVALEDAGEFTGEVADLGCGLGDNAIFLASRGHHVTGLDGAPSAIEEARARAAAAGVEVGFAVADALKLTGYEGRFDTVLDSALYHCFTEEVRHTYVEALTRVTRPGARLHLFCFSEQLPDHFPTPFRISEANLRETVGRDWTIESLEPAIYTTAFDPAALRASVQALLGQDAAFAELETDGKGNVLVPVWQLKAVRR